MDDLPGRHVTGYFEVTDVTRSHKARHLSFRSIRETLLENVLACGQCGNLLRTSFTRRQGQRHVYYVCRAGKKRNPACPQRPVACLDLDRSLRERLEPMRGALPDAVAIQQLLQSVTYDSVTRRVSVELRDGSRFEYLLPLPVTDV